MREARTMWDLNFVDSFEKKKSTRSTSVARPTLGRDISWDWHAWRYAIVRWKCTENISYGAIHTWISINANFLCHSDACPDEKYVCLYAWCELFSTIACWRGNRFFGLSVRGNKIWPRRKQTKATLLPNFFCYKWKSSRPLFFCISLGNSNWFFEDVAMFRVFSCRWCCNQMCTFFTIRFSPLWSRLIGRLKGSSNFVLTSVAWKKMSEPILYHPSVKQSLFFPILLMFLSFICLSFICLFFLLYRVCDIRCSTSTHISSSPRKKTCFVRWRFGEK